MVSERARRVERWRFPWHRTFESGTYRGMLYGIVLRYYPKQVVSLAKARSVPANMREFLSWAQKHHRIDVTASTVERKAGGPASTETCPGGCREFSPKGSNAHSIGLTCTATRLSYMFSSTHGPRREQHMYEKDLLHRLWNLHRFCSARDL